MNIYLSHASSTNYIDELYIPLKTNFGSKHTIFFPHDPQNTEVKANDIIKRSDIILAEVSEPSTGQGIELGWADSANIPIIAICRSGSKPSGSLRFIGVTPVEYPDIDNMIEKLEDLLELYSSKIITPKDKPA